VARAGVAPSFGPFLDGRCGLILAAGYDEAPSVFALAGRYPHQRFLLADDWFNFGSAADLTRPNVSVLAFEADQAAFLAGYTAAAVSENHVVGEYGSTNIPTIDVALNGFLAGARAWGEDFRKQVTILGWNGTDGPFIGNDWNRSTAFSITERLIHGGAHVIFGVAGEATLGSAASAARHRSVYLVGMYNDGYTVTPQYAGRWLTSVVFDLTAPVLAAAARAGPAGGLYVGSIANGGIQLAPFHRLAHLVPTAVAIRLRTLRAGLAQGWISTNPAAYTPLEKETGNGNG
jgi:basic membrane protein A